MTKAFSGKVRRGFPPKTRQNKDSRARSRLEEQGTRSSAKRICLGAFAGAHGVRGEAKVKSFTETPEKIAAYGPVITEDGARAFTLEIVRLLKPDLVLVRAPEIGSREDAAALAGTKLYVERAALPAPEDGAFYIEDLVGLCAFTEDGAPWGRVAAIHNFGAGAIIELEEVPGRKASVMIAFRRETVSHVDLAAGRLILAAAALAEEAGPSKGMPTISDDTGEIVSDDIAVDLDAMREEDA